MAKFKVGEAVIIHSVQSPEFNGKETVIEKVLSKDCFGIVGYKADIMPNGYIGFDEGWAETALRKKHGDEEPSWEAIESITKWNPNREVA